MIIIIIIIIVKKTLPNGLFSANYKVILCKYKILKY